MSFVDIETRRAAAGIDQKLLCQRAGMHAQAYSKLKNRPGKKGATEETLRKLTDALDKLIAEGERA